MKLGGATAKASLCESDESAALSLGSSSFMYSRYLFGFLVFLFLAPLGRPRGRGLVLELSLVLESLA
jgi:hypothetical protein